MMTLPEMNILLQSSGCGEDWKVLNTLHRVASQVGFNMFSFPEMLVELLMDVMIFFCFNRLLLLTWAMVLELLKWLLPSPRF